jgi:hypothetical protein
MCDNVNTFVQKHACCSAKSCYLKSPGQYKHLNSGFSEPDRKSTHFKDSLVSISFYRNMNFDKNVKSKKKRKKMSCRSSAKLGCLN